MAVCRLTAVLAAGVAVLAAAEVGVIGAVILIKEIILRKAAATQNKVVVIPIKETILHKEAVIRGKV
jgi:hypothetical protein